MLTPGTVGSGMRGQVVRLHAKKNPQWASLVLRGLGSSESTFKRSQWEKQKATRIPCICSPAWSPES